MRVLLVGSDCEENLGLAMVAAALVRARHRVEVVAFNEASELEAVAEQVTRRRPELIGLGIQFQHRAIEFLALARRLRELGFRGHLTCGGQYPTMAYRELIAHEPCLDSVVLHEGEATMVELARALTGREALATVSGLALRGPDGTLERTAPRPPVADLDTLPFAHRYRPHSRHLGLPFIPISGSRGCWGSCAFCSITTTHRSARAHSGVKLLRFRSPANIAAEMAALWHAAGGRCLFCFHDETLLLPRPSDTRARLTELRQCLDELGVGEVALNGKCRPDCITAELARELRRLGVVRLFVGVENGSQRGLDHLGRRIRMEQIEQALSAVQGAGIMVCYNLLLFEPDAVLDDVRESIEFIRRHSSVPVNFCRAEAYHGTPLFERLRARGALLGSYLGWDYRISDDRTELAHRIAAVVFRERNFAPEGVANLSMGLGYQAQLLRVLFDASSARARGVLGRADALIQDIALDTARLLEQVVDLAEHADLADHERITRRTVDLALIAAAHNRLSLGELIDVRCDIERIAAEQNHPRRPYAFPERLRAALNRLAVAGCVVATLPGCGGEEGSKDDTGTGGGTAGVAGNSGTGGTGGMVVDAAPGGSGGYTGGYGGADPVAGGSGGFIGGDGGSAGTGGRIVADPAPGGTGGFIGGDGGSPSTGGMVVDAAPGGSGGYTGGRGWGGRTDPVPGGSGGYVGGTGGRLGTGGRTLSDPVPGGSGGFIGGDGGSPSTGGVVSDPATGGSAGLTGGQGGTDTVPGGNGGFVGGDGPPAGAGGYIGGNGGRTSTGGMVIDCAPEGPVGYRATGTSSDEPTSAAAASAAKQASMWGRADATRGQWQDTAPRRVHRSRDLPLYDVPDISLEGRRQGDGWEVSLCGGEPQMTVRWISAEGHVQGADRTALWCPASADDQLTVAVRTSGGVAVATYRPPKERVD
ncbi:MAG: B12-binding domain-containing radical SAM protein [Polyangiaceae bacterium]|nr:B12-binding domain-containing radical SAM protein [Polyangiaceae bacterium]